jgi:hypothetical protein
MVARENLCKSCRVPCHQNFGADQEGTSNVVSEIILPSRVMLEFNDKVAIE